MTGVAKQAFPNPRSFVLFLIPFVVLAIRQWNWVPMAVDGDYAQYLLHAKAIVEGRPYTDTGYIFHPDAWFIGPRAYPPGLPLTLAPIVALAGVHTPLLRLLMLGSLLVFAFVAWRRLAMDVEPWQAAIGAGFAVFAIEGKGAAIGPISDPGFAALMWATVLAVDSTTEWNWRRVLLVTVLGGATISYRMAGLAVIGAYALYVLMTWRSHRGFAALPLVIWAAGGSVLAATSFSPNDLLGLLMGWRGPVANLSMLQHEYLQSLPVAILRPTPFLGLNRLYYVAGALMVVLGLFSLERRVARSFLSLTAVVYVLMLLVSPVGEERYLWPLYPIVGCAMSVGVRRLLDWVPMIPPRVSRCRITLMLFGLIFAAALSTEVVRPSPDVLVGTPNGEALFAWLRTANASSPVRVTFYNPRVAALESGVAAMGNIERSPRAHLGVFADERITHIVCMPDEKSDEAQQATNALPKQFPDRFELAFRNPDFEVYRFVPATANA